MSDHEVGYRKPPKEHRFRKGQSGNPKGRPRKPKPRISIDDAEILRRLDSEIISVGGRRMSRRQAEVRSIFALSIKGNAKARKLIDLLAKGIPDQSSPSVVEMPWEYFGM